VVCLLSPSEPCKKAEVIELPFVSRTLVGPGKHLLHIADRYEANTVLCSFNDSTQYSHLVITVFFLNSDS